jgi:7-cyano-7-deazaguanine synthase
MMTGSSQPARAVVLLSGGLDSATTLALARERGFECYALSVRYGQRHSVEIDAARRIAAQLGAIEHRVMSVDLAGIGGSALTDPLIGVPEADAAAPVAPGIPITYVPARNTLMLSLALAWAEVLQARDLVIGVNAVDYSGYPDCRPAFVAAFESLAAVATRAGIEGQRIRVHAPLLAWNKARIVREGTRLGVDFARTVSCYQPDEEGRACGRCDACRLRRDGFVEAGLPDPTRYAAGRGPA